MSLQLKYFVPFKALGEDTGLALRESLLNIEGTAIDTSVNKNKWQIPQEDLDYFVASLQAAQLRIDHAESALAVIGKVPEAKRVGDTAWFRAEIGDLAIIQKVLRGYLSHVSVQVDSENVECSKCGKQTRTNSMLTHLCPAAWEIVHKPKVRELSIVASPAYEKTEFRPVGFAAAMQDSQTKHEVTVRARLDARKSLVAAEISIARAQLQSLLSDDVGSNREVQEPENKKKTAQEGET